MNVPKQKKILVVEDDEKVRKSLVRLFEASGFMVTSAKSARSAHESMKTHNGDNRFDAIVCDQIMPSFDDGGPLGANGSELFQRIRVGYYPDYEHVPFFLHTGDLELPATMKLQEQGGVVFKKVDDTEKLIDAVLAALT